MKLVFCISVLMFSLFAAESVNAQISYNQADVREVIRDIEHQTPFRFLFRDALIAGKKVTFTTEKDALLETFFSELSAIGIGIRVDRHRHQFFLFNGRSSQPQRRHISVVVLDSRTGASLPFATLMWDRNGSRTGISADEQGGFALPANQILDQGGLTITVSYLGYQSANVSLESGASYPELVVRLEPVSIRGSDVVITGHAGTFAADSLWLYSPGSGFSHFGGANTIRGLGVLPSVSASGAFAGGTHVRGSKSDSFEVLLDGVSIYNHHHFFGLFDAFNADVLRAVGFYYTITPAYYSGPPGATLSYITRTGSQTAVGGSAGISSTAVRGTLEGPLGGGRGSWLISGRHSLIGSIDWLGNTDLLRWGLDINRPNSSPSDFSTRFKNLPVITPLDEYGGFYDLHTKWLYDAGSGRRITLSAYIGGNSAWQDADRIFAIRDDNGRRFVTNQVRTEHDWGNHSFSARYHSPFLGDAFLTTTAGFSRYHTEYLKDDFIYQRSTGGAGQSQSFVSPFSNENTLMDLMLDQQLDLSAGAEGLITAGHTFRQYQVDYAEDNAFSPFFERRSRSWQWDQFVQFSTPLGDLFNLESGLRGHYFSDGGYYRISPRLEIGFQPARSFGIKAGYSRNYQFLHSLTLNNFVMADFWVISNDVHGPSRQDNFTAGIFMRPAKGHLIQVEAYLKSMRDVRLPKINTRAFASGIDFEITPWFNNNEARSRGLEILYAFNPVSEFDFSVSWTLSQAEMRNEITNRGEWYPMEWDRRHQFGAQARVEVLTGVSLRLSGTHSTGAFNRLSFVNDQEPERLGINQRLDAALEYETQIRDTSLKAQLSFFNLLNRKSTLYRAPIFLAETSRQNPRLVSRVVDVYDLGFMPGFELSVRF